MYFHDCPNLFNNKEKQFQTKMPINFGIMLQKKTKRTNPLNMKYLISFDQIRTHPWHLKFEYLIFV